MSRGGYRMRLVTDYAGTGAPRRVRVVRHLGHLGYWLPVTRECSGCLGGSGCFECGYTGKRRGQWFVPFNMASFDRMLDRRWRRSVARREAA